MMESQGVVITCPNPAIDDLDKHGYLFGFPIAHSISPLMHQTTYDALGLRWSQIPLPSTDMTNFLGLTKDPRFYGASVTMPHKVTIIKHLDEIAPEGEAVGACNTIFRRGDRLVGTNTDMYVTASRHSLSRDKFRDSRLILTSIGVRESFFQNVDSNAQGLKGQPGLVIGGGGAARSAVYALVYYLKCPVVYLANRDPAEVDSVISWCKEHGYGDGLVHVASVSHAEKLESPGPIVACVPNVPPVTESERETRRVIETFLAKPHKGAMLEMCYHPTPFTEIAALAEKAGWQVILGTEAVIYQGLEQDSYWTGLGLDQLPLQAVKEVVADALRKARL